MHLHPILTSVLSFQQDIQKMCTKIHQNIQMNDRLWKKISVRGCGKEVT